MIFKKLFRAKYLDPNPQVRIEAIKDLSPVNPEQKSKLHELAFNDSDANVNLAALRQLNSFALWCKVAQTSNTEKVQKNAQVMIEGAVFGHGELTISNQERRQFIQECSSAALLEKVLFMPEFAVKDTDLFLMVLDRVGKPHITERLFLHADSELVQLRLLNKIERKSVLTKALKRTPFQQVRLQVEEKLNQLELKKHRPIELEKSARLLLSKLLALKEQSDLSKLKLKRAEYCEAFEQLKTEFSLLNNDTRQQLEDKYDDLNRQLSSAEQKLEPQWQEQKKRARLQSDLLAFEVESNLLLATVNQALANNVEDITLGQVEDYEQQFTQKLYDFGRLLDAPIQIPKEKVDRLVSIQQQIESCRKILESLPEFQHAIEHARQFLDKFSQLSVPNDHSQLEASKHYLQEQKQCWQNMTKGFKGHWPTSLEEQWLGLLQSWQSAIKKLSADIRQSEQKIKGKLRATQSLIEQGKYKAAMALFDKITGWFERLPDLNQSRLQSQFDTTKNQVEELKDWQSYIALPRKPAILDEVELLAKTPLPVQQQASELKRLRSVWNSLGNTHSETDEALNNAFELAAERAFEPCRIHYEQQEKQRDDNYHKKQTLLEQLESLQHSQPSDQELAEQVNQLQNQWRKVGHIDYRKMDELNHRYQQALKPLVDQVEQFQRGKVESKRNLIKQAKALLASDDVFVAVESAKQLQLQWKSVGAVSKNLENRLWSEFRQANDALFARRQAQLDAQRAAKNNLVQAIEAQLTDAQQQLAQSQSSTDIHALSDSLAEVKSRLTELDSTAAKSLNRTLGKLDVEIEQALRRLQTEQRSDSLARLFEVLHSNVDKDIAQSSLDKLDRSWQQAIKQPPSTELKRGDIVIMLDIMHQQESPPEEHSRRQELQVKMMSDKLQNGQQPSAESLLRAYLSLGVIQQQDLASLARLERHFSKA